MSGSISRWRILDDRVFLFYGAGGPMTDEDCESWLAALERSRFTGYIGGTGSGFNATMSQRRRAFAMLFERKITVATITDSALIRTFIVTPAMLGMKISAFPWSELGRAVVWLELEDTLARRTEQNLLHLRTRVDGEIEAQRGRKRVG